MSNEVSMAGRLMSRGAWAAIRQIEWVRPKSKTGELYRWGHKKSAKCDPAWDKKFLIYRWVNGATNEVVVVGQAGSALSQRVNLYTSGGGQHAGATNKKVYNKVKTLKAKGGFVYLEYTDSVPGFDLTDRRQRQMAESLLIGMWRPLWQF